MNHHTPTTPQTQRPTSLLNALLSLALGLSFLAFFDPLPAHAQDPPPAPTDGPGDTNNDKDDEDDPTADDIKENQDADPLRAINDAIRKKADAVAGTYQRSYAWIEMGGGRFNIGLSAILVNPERPREVFIATQNQVFVSRNSGGSWELVFQLGAGTTSTLESGATRGTTNNFDADARREELINARIEERVEELREELRDELSDSIGDDSIVDDLLSSADGDLRESARADVISSDLEAIDEQVREEQNEASGTPANPTPNDDDDTPNFFDPTLSPITDMVTVPGKGQNEDILVATQSGLFRATSGEDIFEVLLNRPITHIERTDKRILAGTAQGLFASKDNGSTWQAADGELGGERILALDAEGPYAYAATSEAFFMSTNRGVSWKRIPYPSGLQDNRVTSIATNPHKPWRAAISSTIGPFIADQKDDSIRALSTVGLFNLVVQDIAWHPNQDGLLFIATPYGVFTGAEDSVWYSISTGLESNDVLRLAIVHGPVNPVLALTNQSAQAYVPSKSLIDRETILKSLRDQWDKEPSLPKIILGAWKTHNLDPSAWASWRTRSTWSKALPTVVGEWESIRSRKDDDHVDLYLPSGSIRRTRTLDTKPSTRTAGGAFQQWEIIAVWDLNELIFNPNTTSAASTTRSLQRFQQTLTRRIIRLHSTRRIRMLQYALGKDKTAREKIQLKIQILELQAQLTALTGLSYPAPTTPQGEPKP